MPIPTTLESLSTTAASNGPAGSESRTLADDGLRQAYAFIRQLVTKGADIASAATITPPSTGSVFTITGTTTIATIASTNSWNGRQIMLLFAAALTLTHSSNLALPGSASITTAANDAALFVQTGSGAWRCTQYMRADGSLVVPLVTLSADPLLKVRDTGSGRTAVAQAMGGVELTAASMNTTNAYTPAIKFGSTDPQFTTTNPKFGALIVGEATETYAADTDGGMALAFYTTGNDPGTGGALVQALRIAAFGALNAQLYAPNIHNNHGTGEVAPSATGNIESFTFTPVVTGVANVSAVSASVARGIHVGQVVHVAGRLTITPTSGASVATTVGIGLPVGANLDAFTDLSGVATRTSGVQVGSIIGDATNDRAQLDYTSDAASAQTWHYMFSYVIP